MAKKFLLLVGISIGILIFAKCTTTKKDWKYEMGFHVGDVIWYESDLYGIDDDYVYKNEKKIAKIIKVTRKQLIIKSLNDSLEVNIGYYTEL